jgi:hypothetical protein
MLEVPAVVVAQAHQPHQAVRRPRILAQTTLIRVPAIQARFLRQALAVAELVLPAMVALAEIGEQLVHQAVQASRQVVLQVSQYKDGLMLLNLPAQQALAVQQQVKN